MDMTYLSTLDRKLVESAGVGFRHKWVNQAHVGPQNRSFLF